MAVLTVGPGQQFSAIEDAVAASSPGDTIDVQAGTYTNDFVYVGHSLTLQAVGGEVQMVATEEPPNGKAIITEGVPGISVAINGFDISGAAVGDQNGAAIRYEGGNLSLTNDYFHNNQEGLLGAADPSGSISIDNSEIAFNGDGSGFTHGLYIGAIAQFSLTNSYVHDTAVGHEVKSRAQNNTITNDRILDNSGSASYSIDLPNGGNATIANNVIEQSQGSQNPYIIAYAEEGRSNPGANVSISGNTIVNDQTGNLNDAAVFNATSQALPFTNNSVFGLTVAQLSFSGPLAESDTALLTDRPSLDTSSLSFIGNNNTSPDSIGGTNTALISGTVGGSFWVSGSSIVAAGGGNNLIVGASGGTYQLASGSGNDSIYTSGGGTIGGGGGANLLSAGDPTDNAANYIISDGTGDTIVAGAGLDTLASYGSNDLIFGGSGALIAGLAPNSTVSAGTGAETIFGAFGDLVYGNNSAGITFVGGAGGATLVGGAASVTTVFGGSGSSVTFANSSTPGAVMSAGAGNETLSAAVSSSSNTFWAGSGADKLIGGSGSDTLVAGSGFDTMTGGAGSDFFAFINGGTGGNDLINDFTSNDTLALFGYGVAQTNAVIASATGSSITLSDGTTITFANVTVSQIASSIKVG